MQAGITRAVAKALVAFTTRDFRLRSTNAATMVTWGCYDRTVVDTVSPVLDVWFDVVPPVAMASSELLLLLRQLRGHPFAVTAVLMSLRARATRRQYACPYPSRFMMHGLSHASV